MQKYLPSHKIYTDEEIYIYVDSYVFISCERDFVASGDEYTPETTHIRDLYLEKISGEWIHTEISNFSYIKQYYNFKSDGIMLGHILFMTRDSVVINGEKVITDWNRLIDNDIAGEWSLLYKSSSKKMFCILMQEVNLGIVSMSIL